MRFDEVFTKFGEIATEYFARPEARPKQTDFELWLHTLPKKLAKQFRREGFRNVSQMPAFRKWVGEKNGLSFDDFHKERLSPELWEIYQEVRKDVAEGRAGTFYDL